ncbi:MAG: hypothetical protein ACOC0P_01760 [Planctomycetota bacterium]
MMISHPMDLLQVFAQFAAPTIFGLLIIFLLVISVLALRARTERRRLQDFLLNAVRALPHHADIDRSRAMEDQIDAFVHDLEDLTRNLNPLDDPHREALRVRLTTKDESRPYLRSMKFEMWYNAWRTLIEAFPLLGILGTIAAIAVSLNGGAAGAMGDGAAGAAAAATAGEAATTSARALADGIMANVLSNFGAAIWSTGAGLVSALVLMSINAFVEPGFERLVEQKRHVREVVRSVKNHLTLDRT